MHTGHPRRTSFAAPEFTAIPAIALAVARFVRDARSYERTLGALHAKFAPAQIADAFRFGLIERQTWRTASEYVDLTAAGESALVRAAQARA